MIVIKTPEEIKIMAEAGKILAKIMKELEKRVEPGVKTLELDRLAESLIFKYGGRCSFMGYRGTGGKNDKPYPACLCASVNEEIVHVVPSERVMGEGDILSLDLGIFYNGFHADMASTIMVANRANSDAADKLKLIKATKGALEIGIKEAKPGNYFGDISFAVQRYIESRGFNVVRELCGHGIGKNLHEDPEILNYGERGAGEQIQEGMVFCLEPMVAAGDWGLEKSKDGFGYKTKDGSLSAHFEHTIAVTRNGPQVLTKG